MPVGRLIGVGSIWRCDFCGTRWEFLQYQGWRFPITKFFRLLFYVLPLNLLGVGDEVSEWSKPRSKAGPLLEWGAFFLFFVVLTLDQAGLWG